MSKSYLVRVNGRIGKLGHPQRVVSKNVLVISATGIRDAEDQAIAECQELKMVDCCVVEIRIETGIDLVALPPQCPAA